MSVAVDYRCGRCGGRHERRVASPPPAVMPCPACGAGARRVWSPLGVVGRAGEAGSPHSPSPGGAGPSACLTYRDVPALCHLDPTVAAGWIARARGDTRALERELARQEASVAAGMAPADVAGAAHDHPHPGASGPHPHDHGDHDHRPGGRAGAA